MWRDHEKKSKKRSGDSDNRLHLVTAVIFLLFGALVYRLYYVQINQNDVYTAMAANQHEISSKLEPDRGKIMITDSAAGESTEYTLATNKDFYLVYAIPKDITNPAEVADDLYEFFDAPQLVQNITTNLNKQTEDDFTSRIEAINNDESLTPEVRQQQIAAELKRQADLKASGSLATQVESEKDRELETKKAETIEGYTKKLSRPGGMYTVIENKVSDSDLLNFYAFMLNKTATSTTPAAVPVKASDLSLSAGKIINSKTGQAVKLTGFDFEIKKFRYYPENDIASHVLGFVSYANDDGGLGKYGLEEYFNGELAGKAGYLIAINIFVTLLFCSNRSSQHISYFSDQQYHIWTINILDNMQTVCRFFLIYIIIF
jgi:cell division protein FtsI/penicillin-binding protein 2